MITFDYIITNGCVGVGTIYSREEKGWKLIAVLPAKLVHPSACDTDMVAIFSKYTPYTDTEQHETNGNNK